MSGLRVVRAGPLTLLQDGGRPGWLHQGIAASGPLDAKAAGWANRLLGNRWGSPLLEVTLGGLELACEVDTWLAVTGAELSISLDGRPLPNWSRFAVRAGQQLQLGYARTGQRSYLAVAGGFSAEPLLGSVSCHRGAGLGGLHGGGEPLLAGEVLACQPAVRPGAARVPWPFIPDYRAPALLRVITGGDAGDFSEESLEAFFSQDWQLAGDSDRMGARLQGAPISPPLRRQSIPLTRGAIQVPPDGRPIILQADHPSMGGYALLGWLHPLDLFRLAQCPAGHPLRFTPISLGDAQAQLQRFYRFFVGSNVH